MIFGLQYLVLSKSKKPDTGKYLDTMLPNPLPLCLGIEPVPLDLGSNTLQQSLHVILGYLSEIIYPCN